MSKPIASLSLDLDNKWAYLRTHGVSGWDKYPSYLNVALPRIGDWCAARDVRLTCFVVGQDARRDQDGLLAAFATGGHEIGNHSFNHFPWMHTLSYSEAAAEIRLAEEHIERATGQHPIGFRGPGYSLSGDMLEILASRGYRYDASTLPTPVGPLARWYFRHMATKDAADVAQRRELFGSFREFFRPNRPYVWDTACGPLIEIPVTTFPLVRMPIHMTYVWYLYDRSPALARGYVRWALRACRLLNVGPSILLHTLDFLGAEDEPDLSFFPGMRLSSSQKHEMLAMVWMTLASHFRVVTMREHAAVVAGSFDVELPNRAALPLPEPIEATAASAF